MSDYESYKEISIPTNLDLPEWWVADKLAELKRMYPDIEEIYDDVRAYVLTQDTVTASHLSRKYRFGYTASARVIDKLEAEGIVGPYDKERGYREVLRKE